VTRAQTIFRGDATTDQLLKISKRMVGFSALESTHLDSSSRLDIDVCIYLNLFRIIRSYFSVVSDVSVNSEVPVVTSSTSRSAGSVFQR
jgi:hypothetical protein